MRSRASAGVLLFRGVPPQLEVLLVHPGGPLWRNKDKGAWTVPKGEIADAEDPLAAAVREFEEEIGACPKGDFIELTPVRQRGGKLVHVWALRGDLDPATITSNRFSMEWPPHSGLQASFPEVDRGAWFDMDEARCRILAGQRPLLDELESRLTA